MLNYDFNQIQLGLIAFVEDIEKKLQFMIDDLPVFVLETGDGTYMMNKKFDNVNKEVYEKNPRFVIKFVSFSHENSMDTNIFNRLIYIYGNDYYTTQCRRLQIDVSAVCTMVSPNFIKALEHMQMLLSLITRENVFTYEYMGSTFNGAYSVDAMQDVEMPDLSTTETSIRQNLDVSIQLHIYVPRVETIKPLKDVEYSEVKTDIGIINNTDKKIGTDSFEETQPIASRKDIDYPYYEKEDDKGL